MVGRRIVSRILPITVVLGFGLAMLLSAGLASAQTIEAQTALCTDENEAPEQRLPACNWLIDTAEGISDERRASFYAHRANAYSEMQEYQLATADYDRAISSNPEDVIAISNRATAYRYLGQHDLAIQDYDRAIRLDPHNPVHFFNRAGAHSEEGQYLEAIEDYTRTIELNPDLPPVHMDRANAYVETEQYARAIEDFTAVIRLAPDHADAYAGRANAYANTRQFERAIKDFREAILLEPDNDFIYVNLGYAYFEIGQYKDALASIEEALTLDPDNVRAQGALAWLYAAAKDPAYRKGDEALRLAREAVLARPSPEYLKTLAAAYVEIGDPDNAFAAYQDAILLGGSGVISAYQAYLADKKFYAGPVNGIFDPATEAAIRACIGAGCKLLAD